MPSALRRLHALDAGHAIVDRDDQRRPARGGAVDDFRRQAIAEPKPVGHQEIDVRETHRPQGAHHQRTARRPVRVEVADDQHASASPMRREKPRRVVDPLQRADRQQAPQRKIEFLVVGHAARRIHAPQNRMQVCGERPARGRATPTDVRRIH